MKEHGWADPKVTELKVFKGTILNIATQEKSESGSYQNDDINRYTSIFGEAALDKVLANLRLEI